MYSKSVEKMLGNCQEGVEEVLRRERVSMHESVELRWAKTKL